MADDEYLAKLAELEQAADQKNRNRDFALLDLYCDLRFAQQSLRKLALSRQSGWMRGAVLGECERLKAALEQLQIIPNDQD